MGRTVIADRKEILEIMYDELDNQPMASQKVKDAYDSLNDSIDTYVNAVQEDAFYFWYVTAMKRYGKVQVRV